MDYFTILDLKKEPFSNSPDPEFFFHSRQHLDCLQKLELSLLLRRGLNVIIGDVGTGKTTMCRQLIRRFSQKDEVETHLILDPYFLNASEFLAAVTQMLTGKELPAGSHDWQAKEVIKQHLFSRGVDENKTVVLIIDEGQKFRPSAWKFCASYSIMKPTNLNYCNLSSLPRKSSRASSAIIPISPTASICTTG